MDEWGLLKNVGVILGIRWRKGPVSSHSGIKPNEFSEHHIKWSELDGKSDDSHHWEI